MATHDYVLADAAGAAFRADLNDALEAIVSQNSNATEPTTTYAYQFWADTTSGWVKQRNAANSAWEKKFPIAKARVDVASAATLDLDANAVTSDYLRITGTTTVTAVTLAAGQRRIAVAGGAFQLTNSASLIVQGGADYTTTTGDLLLFLGESGGAVRVAIMKADGTTVAPGVSAAVQGAFKNLALSATGTNASVTASYDALVLADGSGSYITDTSASATINTATTGAGGLDTGTLAGSTWYSVWRIAKADGTKSWLISLSATAPTMPSGYTYKARIGWIRTDGTGNKYPLKFMQYGRIVQWVAAAGTNLVVIPVIASGINGNVTTPTYVAASWSAAAPTTAARLSVLGTSGFAKTIIVAPNASYGAYNSNSNPPPIVGSSTGGTTSMAMMVPESSNIYWAGTGADSLVSILGWEDNL